MPKNGFPISTAKNGFQILNLHPKKYVFKKLPFLLMPIYLKNFITVGEYVFYS